MAAIIPFGVCAGSFLDIAACGTEAILGRCEKEVAASFRGLPAH